MSIDTCAMLLRCVALGTDGEQEVQLEIEKDIVLLGATAIEDALQVRHRHTHAHARTLTHAYAIRSVLWTLSASSRRLGLRYRCFASTLWRS